MNTLESLRPEEATSTGTTFGKPLVLVGAFLVGLGTSPATVSAADAGLAGLVLSEQTSAGGRIENDVKAGTAIAEIRRLSGLNWEQLARVFGVTRRALHFWASGKPMTPANEERLHRILATVRVIDRGSPEINRTILFEARRGGLVPLDLLADGRYDSLVVLVGEGRAPHRRPAVRPAGKARVARPIYSPDELIGAMQDRVHPEFRGARGVRTAKVKGSGGR